jgi:hypothetical protein
MSHMVELTDLELDAVAGGGNHQTRGRDNAIERAVGAIGVGGLAGVAVAVGIEQVIGDIDVDVDVRRVAIAVLGFADA